MRPIRFSEILSLEGYEARRPQIQRRILAVKSRRRVILPPHLSLLFENRDTVFYQIHEMLRAERIVKTAAVRHEIRTYNDLVPRKHELRATLFIEIPDLHRRREELDRFRGLPSGRRLWLEIGGERFPAAFDPNQFTESRVAAVQYLTFALGRRGTEALARASSAPQVVCDHPANRARAILPAALRRELAREASDAGGAA